MRDHLGMFALSSDLKFAKGILLLDDCEGAFTWTPTGTGGDDVHEYAAAAAFTGDTGMRLKTRTTSAAAGDTLGVYKWLSYPESGLAVVRARLASPTIAAPQSIEMVISVCDGSNLYQAQIGYRPNTPDGYYINSAGAVVSIPQWAFGNHDLQFSTMELVIDTRALQYLTAHWNGTSISLAGLALEDMGAYASRGLQALLGVTTIAAAPAELYADNIYVGEYLEV